AVAIETDKRIAPVAIGAIGRILMTAHPVPRDPQRAVTGTRDRRRVIDRAVPRDLNRLVERTHLCDEDVVVPAPRRIPRNPCRAVTALRHGWSSIASAARDARRLSMGNNVDREAALLRDLIRDDLTSDRRV